MKKISLVVVGLVLFVFGIILSCDSNENQKNLREIKEINLTELGVPETVILDNLSLYKQEIYSQAQLDLNARKFLIKNGLDIKEDIIALTTFFVNDSKEIDTKNLLGFGVFYKKDRQLREKFVIKAENNLFTEKYDMLNKELSMNDIIYKFTNYIENSTNLDFGFKLIVSQEINFEDFNSQRSEFKLFRNYNTFKNFTPKNKILMKGFTVSDASRAPVAQPFLCNAWCSTSSFGSCGFYSGQCSGGCMATTAEVASTINHLPVSDIETAFVKNDDLRHNLRDSFLINKLLGQKYIAYYYGLSDFIIPSDFDLDLISKIVLESPRLDKSISKVLKSGNLSEIIIDTNFKNQVFEILDRLKIKSSNSEFKAVLDDLKNDINYFSNKTKAVILNEIY